MPSGTRSANSSSLLDDADQAVEKPSQHEKSNGESRGKLWMAAGLALIAFAALAFVAWTSISSWRNSPEVAARTMPVVDVETGQAFTDFRAPRGATFPFVNPKTGKATLFPAEACYWTKDGKAKFPPTYVILNDRLGKPGPTKCPDCGRNVRLFNPMPPDALMQQAWDAAQSTNKR
ncbi:MAG: hypothetical protein J0L78_03010 [Planctomycetes bacterium]|nr:hypothetical protein [Planctomycetota bacterium]